MYVGWPGPTVSSLRENRERDDEAARDPGADRHALVYVGDGERYRAALAAEPPRCPIVAKDARLSGWLPFDTLTACSPLDVADLAGIRGALAVPVRNALSKEAVSPRSVPRYPIDGNCALSFACG